MTGKELYDAAKESYYGGNEIMTDLEFDNLESELGLENSGYVGTHHQKSYTVKHPFVMGSLSKVQIKESPDRTIDWDGYGRQVGSYVGKSGCPCVEVSPKYDGCSFETVISKNGDLVSVSTRGDGEFGKDIKVWFLPEWERNFKGGVERVFIPGVRLLVVRGECLVKKSVFNEKYAGQFTVPRSFVAGVLGQDWTGSDGQLGMRSDLSWVCYDYRVVHDDGRVEEIDWSGFGSGPDIGFGDTGHVEKFRLPLDLRLLYDRFSGIREKIDYCLDGFVVKPERKYRLADLSRARPADCVAVKFLPEIVTTVLEDVEWNTGKTSEYFPTGIIRECVLGGKKVRRVSLSNWNTIVEKGIGVGSELEVSLAGDIIPFVYGVKTSGSEIPLPEDSFVRDGHLMKAVTEDDMLFARFLNSVRVIRPDGIGEKAAGFLFGIMKTGNITDFMVSGGWKSELGKSKSETNIVRSLEERRRTLDMPTYIQSLGFPSCGRKFSIWLARKWSGIEVSGKGINEDIVTISENSELKESVLEGMERLGIRPMEKETGSGRTKVILTGSPKDAGFGTKSEFLAMNPELEETSDFNECGMLITGSLDSESSKMKKARKKGIEIRTYSDFKK